MNDRHYFFLLVRFRNLSNDINSDLGFEVAVELLEMEKIYFKASSMEDFFEVSFLKYYRVFYLVSENKTLIVGYVAMKIDILYSFSMIILGSLCRTKLLIFIFISVAFLTLIFPVYSALISAWDISDVTKLTVKAKDVLYNLLL